MGNLPCARSRDGALSPTSTASTPPRNLQELLNEVKQIDTENITQTIENCAWTKKFKTYLEKRNAEDVRNLEFLLFLKAFETNEEHLHKDKKSTKFKGERIKIFRLILSRFFNEDGDILPLSDSATSDYLMQAASEPPNAVSNEDIKYLSAAKDDPTVWHEGLEPKYLKFLSQVSASRLAYCVFSKAKVSPYLLGPPMMGVGLGASGHTPTMENHSSVNATPSMPGMVPTIKEEAETSADSLTIDVEGDHEDSTINKLKAENDPIESKAWINALRTHVVVPLIRHPKSLSFRKPVDPIALGIYPVYNQIVTHPMDLGTIKSRIDDDLYSNKVDLIADIQLVWNNAKKFNPKTHAVYEAADFLEKFSHERIDKIKRDGPHSISRPIAPLPPPRESSKRDARKKSLDLPGETHLPQHLEQNRAASGSMRACENLLRILMTQKMHRDYVEPFIEIHRKGDSEIYEPMSLSKIQNRLRSNSYHHPLEFAADMRRIVTETYRYTAPKDPLIELAGKLQSEFEYSFAKIDFQEDEIMPPIYSGLSEDDRFISKLLTAQNVMVNIQTELTGLIQDYIIIKKKDQKRKEKKSNVQTPASASSFKSQSQKRKLTSSLPKPKAKKAKVEKQKQPNQKQILQQGMLKTRKNNLTLEEGNRLKQQIANLSPAQQMTVLEILRENKEKLDQDEEGNVEMEFRDFTQKSINDLQAYVNSVTNPPPSQNQEKNSDDEEEDDSSDSSSSSDSDSDSD